MKLSFIVATRNRAHAIIECLDSIAAALANAAPLDAEIIIVDNGSADNTADTIKAWARASGLRVKLLSEPRAGKARALNCALRAAEGELLAFTDDDCRLHSEYLNDLLRHDAADIGLVLRGGRVELGDPFDLALTIKTDDEAADYAHPMHPAGFIHGANMTTSRAVADRIGLFDERFGPGTPFPGEDCDYVIRAHAAGLRVQYVPDMIVLHFHGRRDKQTAHRLFSGYMRANGALYIKHLRSSPLLIRHLWWDVRHWVKELRGHSTPFMAEVGIGHKQIVVGNIIGMFHFTSLQVRAYLLSLFRS
jgi:GT2 family glycosyltransferase